MNKNAVNIFIVSEAVAPPVKKATGKKARASMKDVFKSERHVSRVKNFMT